MLVWKAVCQLILLENNSGYALVYILKKEEHRRGINEINSFIVKRVEVNHVDKFEYFDDNLNDPYYVKIPGQEFR